MYLYKNLTKADDEIDKHQSIDHIIITWLSAIGVNGVILNETSVIWYP